MIAITGNTYPVKDQIKGLGGKWDMDAKCWMVPDAKEDEARKLVAAAPITPRKDSGSYRPRKCVVCGHTPRYGDRYDRIYKSGECRDCYEERKMGY